MISKNMKKKIKIYLMVFLRAGFGGWVIGGLDSPLPKDPFEAFRFKIPVGSGMGSGMFDGKMA